MFLYFFCKLTKAKDLAQVIMLCYDGNHYIYIWLDFCKIPYRYVCGFHLCILFRMTLAFFCPILKLFFKVKLIPWAAKGFSLYFEHQHQILHALMEIR